ncbi:MAG TPA: hypothetical protein VLM40_03940, partial [Gemmata sp.]|nr:hypothetical protein [Gemmata sp.]
QFSLSRFGFQDMQQGSPAARECSKKHACKDDAIENASRQAKESPRRRLAFSMASSLQACFLEHSRAAGLPCCRSWKPKRLRENC